MIGAILSERPHKRLAVWKRSMELVIWVYTVTKGFPREEEFGLKAQLRRAAVSIPSNIAEGLTRRSHPDTLHFLNIAQASLSEVDTQLELALALCFVSEHDVEAGSRLMAEVGRMLTGLSRAIAR